MSQTLEMKQIQRDNKMFAQKVFSDGARKAERGSALLQVMLVFVLLGILSVSVATLMRNSDRSSLSMVNRNLNLNLSMIISDNINDTYYVKEAALTFEQPYP